MGDPRYMALITLLTHAETPVRARPVRSPRSTRSWVWRLIGAALIITVLIVLLGGS